MLFRRPLIEVSELIQKVYPGKKVNPNLLQFFENYRLTDVSPLLIEEYRSLRLQTVSNASVNREVSALKHCFSQAIV